MLLRVSAAFFAEAERVVAGRAADASPPAFPPFSDDSGASGLPRAEPDLLPPPDFVPPSNPKWLPREQRGDVPV